MWFYITKNGRVIHFTRPFLVTPVFNAGYAYNLCVVYVHSCLLQLHFDFNAL